MNRKTNNRDNRRGKPWVKWTLAATLCGVAAWLLAGALVGRKATDLWRMRALHDAQYWLSWARTLRPWEQRWSILAARCARMQFDIQTWRQLRERGGERPEWKLEEKLRSIESGAIGDNPQQEMNDLLAAGGEPDMLIEAFALGFMQRGDFDQARAVLHSGDRDGPNFRYLEGRIAEWRDERSKAQDSYRQSLQNNPRHEPARWALARLLRQDRQYQEAAGHYQYLIHVTDGDQRAWLAWVDCARHLGAYAEAQAALDQHVTTADDERSVLRQRGTLALENGDYKAAAAWFQQGEPWPDDDLTTWEAAATAFQLAGDAQRAEEYFDQLDDASRRQKQSRDQRVREVLGRR